MGNIQDELKKWAKEVVEVYNPIKRSYYTQSDLTKITVSPEILILGINPGSTGNEEAQPITADVFLKGNKNFCDREKSWYLWKTLEKFFQRVVLTICLTMKAASSFQMCTIAIRQKQMNCRQT